MSDYSAINGVSLTLRKLLLDRMEFTPNDLAITISTPYFEANQTPSGGNPTPEGDRVNLFLYQVSENPFLKNQDLPSNRGSNGTLPLSLNLHYLITAYGSTLQNGTQIDESRSQQLLGSVMRVLNDYPNITESLLTNRLSPVGQTILDPALRGEFETIKLCLDPISVEDMTKIWTALTVPYRLSVAYSVSVIQIESQESRRFPQLVGEPLRGGGPFITVLPLQTPFIESVAMRAVGDPPDVVNAVPYVHVGDTLIISGQNFGTDDALVILNGVEIPIRPQFGTRIEIVVPDDTYSFQGITYTIPVDQRLQPGLLVIEVKVAPPGAPEAASRSNQGVAMLTPFVQAITPLPASQPRTLRLTGTRLYAEELRCESIIGRVTIPSSAYVIRTPTQIELSLPLVLPFTGANAYFGQELANFPNLNGALPSLNVTIGGVSYTGPNSVKLLTSPTSFAEAAAALEEALHKVANREPQFTLARVITENDADVNNSLIIIPGVLTDTVSIQSTGQANQLGLGILTQRKAYFSGALDPFPTVTNVPSELSVTFNTSQTITLAQRPTSLADAAIKLQAAIRASGGGTDFTQAEVLVVDSQLVIAPGQNSTITIDGVAGVDETTVTELQLSGSYPVRVRVNGAEGIGGINQIGLPL